MGNERERVGDKFDGTQEKRRNVNVDLPEYNDKLGKFFKVPDRPQSEFKGVVTEFYPLRADLDHLRNFCNRYLNADGKHQPVWFEPMAPWVLLQVCKYGKMAFRQQNVGWVSQHELAFGFPVRMSERDQQGAKRFKDWTLVYPFIYVDNPLSMSFGRQVYGWGKAGMELLGPRPDPEPHTRCLLSVELSGGPERHATRTPDAPRFLEIFQQGSALSGNTSFASLYTLLPRVLLGSLQAASVFLGAASSFSTDVRNAPTLDTFFDQLQNMAAQMFGAFDYLDGYMSAASALARDLELMNPARKYDLGNVNIVTLKQFRDAEGTTKACYRALVMSKIKLSRLMDGGMLRTDLMSPDLSGGVQIRINQSEGDQIVNDLGIKYDHEDGSSYVLRPVSPFWLKADLSYGPASAQYWRTRETRWARPDALAPQAPPDTDLPYILKGSGAYQEIPGKVTSRNFTYKVFALPAKKETLSNLLKEYLEDPLKDSKFEFEIRTAENHPMPEDKDTFILAIFSSNVIDEEDEEGRKERLSDRVVTFALPVWCSSSDRPDTKRRALVPLYTLLEEDWDYATQSEIYGRFSFKSLIEGEAPSWIEKHNVDLQALRAHTLLFPTLSEEEPARLLPVVQVNSSQPVFEESESQRPVIDETTAPPEVLAYLELLGLDRRPDRRIRYVALKQVRDAVHFRHASYQALVGVTSTLENVPSELQFEQPIQLLIYKYHDEFDIAEKMGLHHEDPRKSLIGGLPCQEYTINSLKGIRLRGKTEVQLSENLAWSIKKGEWNRSRKQPDFFSKHE